MYVEYLKKVMPVNPNINDNSVKIYEAHDADGLPHWRDRNIYTRALEDLYFIHAANYVRTNFIEMVKRATKPLWTNDKPIYLHNLFHLYGSTLFTNADIDKYCDRVNTIEPYDVEDRLVGEYARVKPEYVSYTPWDIGNKGWKTGSISKAITKGSIYTCRVTVPLRNILIENYWTFKSSTGKNDGEVILGTASPYMELMSNRSWGSDLLGEYL